MASSGNFCTLNPLAALGNGTPNFGALSNGNTTAELEDTAFGNFGVTSGKWYWEFVVTSSSPSGQCVGWANQQVNSTPELGYNSPSSGTGAQIVYLYLDKNPPEIISDAPKSASSGTDVDYGSVIGQNDIVGIAGDFDNDKWYFSINGSFTDMRSSQDPATGTNPLCSATGGGGLVTIARTAGLTWFPAIGSWAAPTRTMKVNFGQDSTFSGQSSLPGTSAAAADGNGFGDFYYTPPTGFLALCTANLPISEDIDPNETDDDHPQKLFGILTYTGNGTSNNAISGLGFQPDLVWTKDRSNTADYSNALVDSSRGRAKVLYSHRTDKQPTDSTSTQDLKSFDSDGFTVGTGSNIGINASTHTYVGWCWKCDGGTTSTNTSGTATSSVQVNTKAGFSICLTDNYTSGTGVTIGHGLGAKPTFYIHKPTGDNSSGGASQAFNWHVYHHSLGATKALLLNSSNAPATGIGYWNNTEPTSTVLSLGNLIAGNGQSCVWAWTDIEGYSKFGSYEGNGNTDGAFVYTGFKPRMVFLKQLDGAAEWAVYDTARDTVNMAEKCLEWDLNAAEKNSTNLSTDGLDFLSNGFKFRGGGGGRTNQSSATYVFGAWADVPFKYNNSF